MIQGPAGSEASAPRDAALSAEAGERPAPGAAPAAPAASRVLRWGYPLLGVVLMAVYAPTLARGATFSDGPEILTAITTLGVAHPTGYPIFIVVAHYFAVLFAVPLPQCVKVEVFNALCAVGAALLTARAAREVALLAQARAGRGDPRDADVAGIVAGAFLGVSPLLWQEVRIPEVYPFHMLLVTWAGYAWVRFEVTRDVRHVVHAALPMGMGLAHHVTMVYMLPAGFLYLLVRRPSFFVEWLVWPVAAVVRRFRPGFMAARKLDAAWAFPVACLVGALPMLSYYYLIWANAHTTGVPWNDVNSWSRLYDHATGRQYRGFLGGGDLAAWWSRIKKLPAVFDKQFLPPGTALFAAGLIVTLRRAPRLAVLLLAVLILNVGHGIYYSVGDYASYYLPALFPCAVIIGAGYSSVARVARTRASASRPWLCLAAAGAMLGAAAIAVPLYARFTKRFPAAVAAHGAAYVWVPLAVLAIASIAGAVWVRRRAAPRREIPPSALPTLLVVGLAATLAPVAAARGFEIGGQVLIGESYGAELASSIPRGSVLMTQGDGFIFTMWYEHHVLGRGLDFATLDVGTLKGAWYQRYVRSHYPLSCDPLSPKLVGDPAAYDARCATFAQRMALGDKEPWVSMGLRGGRAARAGLSSGLVPAGDRAGGLEPVGLQAEVARGGDPRCREKEWSAQHRSECRCWNYEARKASLSEDCVESAEEGGIVPREPVEMMVQRIIEDHIDERPIYERNALTFWIGDTKLNPRGWNGPAYQRVSADYALINRGRFNQVLHFDDIKDLDPCARESLRRITPRPLGVPRGGPSDGVRRHYVPNRWPTLLAATYLTNSPKGTDDDASRDFEAGDTLHMRLHWFERYQYDAGAEGRRGAPIRHGLRVCTFDPSGRRVALETVTTGAADSVAVLATTASSAPGEYTVQACSVGEVGEGPVPADAACQRILLEYRFTLRSRGRD